MLPLPNLPILFIKSYVKPHTRVLKDGRTIQIDAHYDKRTKKGAEQTGHGHDVSHLGDDDKKRFERMHAEQHLLHHYHGHALRKQIAEHKTKVDALAKEVAEHRKAGRHKEAAATENRRWMTNARMRRHEHELADVDARVKGIAAMKEAMVKDSGAVGASTDKSHHEYAKKLGTRWAGQKLPEKAKPKKKPEIKRATSGLARQTRSYLERKKVDPANDDILTAVAKLGGISLAEVSGTAMSDHKRPTWGIARPFHNGPYAMSMADAVERLHELGYPVVDGAGNYSENALEAVLDRATRGERIIAVDGAESEVERLAANRDADIEAQQADDWEALDQYAEEQAWAPMVARPVQARLRGIHIMGEAEFDKFEAKLGEKLDSLSDKQYLDALESAMDAKADEQLSAIEDYYNAQENDGRRQEGAQAGAGEPGGFTLAGEGEKEAGAEKPEIKRQDLIEHYKAHREAFLSRFSGRDAQSQRSFVEAAESAFGKDEIRSIGDGFTVQVDNGNGTMSTHMWNGTGIKKNDKNAKFLKVGGEMPIEKSVAHKRATQEAEKPKAEKAVIGFAAAIAAGKAPTPEQTAEFKALPVEEQVSTMADLIEAHGFKRVSELHGAAVAKHEESDRPKAAKNAQNPSAKPRRVWLHFIDKGEGGGDHAIETRNTQDRTIKRSRATFSGKWVYASSRKEAEEKFANDEASETEIPDYDPGMKSRALAAIDSQLEGAFGKEIDRLVLAQDAINSGLMSDADVEKWASSGSEKPEESANQEAAKPNPEGPKDGDTRQGADGTLVFRDGRWHKQGEGEESEQGDFNPENHIKIAADSIEQLRKQDVHRLYDSAPHTHEAWESLTDYMRENRPDLMGEVHDVRQEIGAPKDPEKEKERKEIERRAEKRLAHVKATGKELLDYLAGGGKLVLGTKLRNTPLSSPDHLRVVPKGVQMQQGSRWVDLLSSQVDDLKAQMDANPLASGGSGFNLASQTPEEIAQQEADRKAKQEAEAEAERKARADKEDFVLTGSTSKVDEAEARGQQNLFDGAAKAAEKKTSDTFSVDRMDAGAMKPQAFERGETVKVSGSRPMTQGVIAGISHAEGKAKVGSVWYPFGYIYKQDYDEFAKDRKEVDASIAALSARIDSGNTIDAVGIIDRIRGKAKLAGLTGYADTLGELEVRASRVGREQMQKIKDEDEKKAAAAAKKSVEAKPPQVVRMTMEEWKKVHRGYKSTTGGRSVMALGGMYAVEIVKDPAQSSNGKPVDMVTEPAGPKEGDTKTENGVTYVLRDGRWHREGGDEGKAEKPAKAAETPDDLDPNSPNYRYRDTGMVAGARKFNVTDEFREAVRRGQLVRHNQIDWEGVEENPRQAKELITKSNLFGKVDWDALKEHGMEPGAGFLVDRVYASVGKEPPEDSPAARKDYALGIETIRERLEACRTPDEVQKTLTEMRDEWRGVMLSGREADEYKAADAEVRKLREAYQPLKDAREALSDKVYKLYMQINSLDVEKLKYERRHKGKSDPEIDSRIAEIRKALSVAQEELAAFEAANNFENKKRNLSAGWTTTENDHEWEIRKATTRRNAIMSAAAEANVLSNPTTRAWSSLGPKFHAILNGKSEAFLGHRANVRTGRVTDWSWAEKTGSTAPGTTKRAARFQLEVADQVERVGGKPVKIDSTSALKETFGLREVQSGNWVLKDPESAQWHVQRAAEALTDLSDLIGVDPKTVAMNGRLALAFGARGKGNAGYGGAARAHYEPISRICNITKMQGGGTLAHEWFHALDNLIGEHHGKSMGADAFITEDEAARKALPPEVAQAFEDLGSAMRMGVHRVTKTIAITDSDRRMASSNIGYGAFGIKLRDAGSLDSAIDAIDEAERSSAARGRLNKKQASTYEKWRKIAAAHYSAPDAIEAKIKSGPGMSSFALEARKLDSNPDKPYWSQPKEMAARAFQAWTEDRLAEKGRKNDYLSAKADNKYYQNGLFGPMNPFPEGEERETINRAFDALFAAMAQHKTMTKSLGVIFVKRKRPPVLFFKTRKRSSCN